ncbi:hypothetical protein A9Q78_10490 [Methylophaga sp. 41_12_T18]|nr:hypothetical protein A9Q78_10490 [Methylophaga sp. 41_12_T18]
MVNIQKIPSLNGIRAISVLLVVMSHAGFGGVVPGGFGVTIFFFLSGFLITTLFIKEVSETSKINIFYFYARRAIRLYPAMLVTLTVAYSLVYFDIIGGEATLVGAAAQVFYFANYFTIFFDGGNFIPAGTGILWSLAVEEHFYAVYPIIFTILLLKAGKKKLLTFLWFVVVFALLWRLSLVCYHDVASVRILYASDTRIDSIVFGCILALYKNPVNSIEKRDLSLYDMAFILAAVSIVLFSFIYRDEAFRLSLRYTLQGLALCVLFFYSIAFYKHSLFSFLNSAIMNKIGVYSYSIYLVHFILIEIVETSIPQFSNKFIMLPVVVLVSFCFSSVIDRFIEGPLKVHRARYR